MNEAGFSTATRAAMVRSAFPDAEMALFLNHDRVTDWVHCDMQNQVTFTATQRVRFTHLVVRSREALVAFIDTPSGTQLWKGDHVTSPPIADWIIDATLPDFTL